MLVFHDFTAGKGIVTMVRAIVGANWGDEGKGKITDVLAEDSDVVVRYQGGANAGHTIINDFGKFALHLLPSGVFHSRIANIIGPGWILTNSSRSMTRWSRGAFPSRRSSSVTGRR